MPLIHCPICQGNVSTAAQSCPHCGHPLKAQDVHITHKQDDSYEKGRQEQLGKQDAENGEIMTCGCLLVVIVVVLMVVTVHSC